MKLSAQDEKGKVKLNQADVFYNLNRHITAHNQLLIINDRIGVSKWSLSDP